MTGDIAMENREVKTLGSPDDVFGSEAVAALAQAFSSRPDVKLSIREEAEQSDSRERPVSRELDISIDHGRSVIADVI